MKESDGYVRALARGLAVVEALGRPPGRHTLSEVAVATDLSRAAVRRVFATLDTLNFAEADGRYYRLRPRALGLGLSYLTGLPFWGQSHQVLEDLRGEIGESCALAVLDGSDIVYVLRAPSRRILATHLGIGSRLPAHLVSLGRVLLAAEAPETFEERLATIDMRPRTPRSIATVEGLRNELEKVRGQGYSWVDGELDPAICGLAVPVRDQQGHVISAVSVNAISGTFSEADAVTRFLVPLRRAAQEIRARS